MILYPDVGDFLTLTCMVQLFFSSKSDTHSSTHSLKVTSVGRLIWVDADRSNVPSPVRAKVDT